MPTLSGRQRGSLSGYLAVRGTVPRLCHHLAYIYLWPDGLSSCSAISPWAPTAQVLSLPLAGRNRPRGVRHTDSTHSQLGSNSHMDNRRQCC